MCGATDVFRYKVRQGAGMWHLDKNLTEQRTANSEQRTENTLVEGLEEGGEGHGARDVEFFAESMAVDFHGREGKGEDLCDLL